jgi:hypothetical protein
MLETVAILLTLALALYFFHRYQPIEMFERLSEKGS